MMRAWGRCIGGTLTLAIAVAGCASPVDPQDAQPARYVESPAISPQARQVYGGRAEEAYREVVDLVMTQSLEPDLLDPRRTTFTHEQLSGSIPTHLAPHAQQVWSGYVDRAVAGDEASREVVDVLRVHSIDEPQLSMPEGGHVVTNQAVSGATVDLAPTTAAGEKPLAIGFEHSARLDYRSGRAPYPGSVDRSLSFTVLPTEVVAARSTGTPTPAATTGAATVAPAAGARWLITSFEGTTTFSFDDASDDATPAS